MLACSSLLFGRGAGRVRSASAWRWAPAAREVLALVARQAAIVISIGLAPGTGRFVALTRLLKSALVGVTATDPSTSSVVSLALAVLACLVPTRLQSIQPSPFGTNEL